jgi:uncharacterized repeat protein (TIGR02543 family)
MVLLMIFTLLPVSPGGITARAGTSVTITYQSSDVVMGSVSPTQEVIINSPDVFATGSSAAANPGYHFVNWTDDAYGVSTEAAFVPKPKDGYFYAAAIYTANFAPNTYNVAFNANGGTGEDMGNQFFTYGESQSLYPNLFQLKGYVFTGWNTNKDGSGTMYADGAEVKNLTQSVGGTVNLYAQWAPESYLMTAKPTSLTFADTVVGNTPPEAQEITVTNTGNTNLIIPFNPDAIAEAADFSVFPEYTSDVVRPGETVMISVRPNAGLVVGDYNENFTIKDSTEKFNTLTVSLHYTVLSTENAPLNLTETKEEDTLAADQNVIYASPANASESDAEIEYCDMSVGKDTATLSDAKESQHFAPGKSQKMKSFTWNGVTYTKWKVFYTDDTMTCKYIYVMHNQAWDITFNGNGGTAGTASAKTDEDGYLTSLPAASRSGYTFAGWYTESTGGTQVSKNTQFTSSATLYAHWTFAGGTPGDTGSTGGSGSIPSHAVSTGTWQQDSTGYWYRYTDGTWPANEWKEINGKWYHFNENGYMQTGWILDNGKWYYLDGSGAMVTGYFHAPDDHWYYFWADGSMAVGDVTIEGKTHYFNDQYPAEPTYEYDPDKGTWVPNGNPDLPYGAEKEQTQKEQTQ